MDGLPGEIHGSQDVTGCLKSVLRGIRDACDEDGSEHSNLNHCRGISCYRKDLGRRLRVRQKSRMSRPALLVLTPGQVAFQYYIPIERLFSEDRIACFKVAVSPCVGCGRAVEDSLFGPKRVWQQLQSGCTALSALK